ncbi:MAG TPA: PAS domain S-box protein [Atribacterota bacterium]|nr:PAS domain S-box protein [Atribacterota bacterium]
MKDESKTKEELIKDLKTLRKKGEKSAVNNIIERKQAEEKLQDSEDYLKMLFDYAPDAYYISDLKGNFIDGNLAAERLTGYKREELIGENFLKLKLFSPINIPKITKLLVKSLEGQPTGPDEFVLNRKDNSKVAVEISTYPVKIKGETLVLSIARDITERKKAIKEIEELAKFPAEDPNPVLRISKDGTVLYHNHSSESLLEHWHYQEGKALQDRWIQLVIDALRDDDIKTAETEMDDKLIFLTFAPIAEKDFVNVYGSDITELKQGEERIKHLNLVLRAIRNINQLIFKEKDREGLIKGVCNSLTETRGYYSTFIVLFDEEGKIDTYAEAGLGKDFLPMLERLKRGELTTFGQIALKQEEVVIIKDPASACPDCPLAQVCSDRGSVMTVRLGRDGKIYGVMSVSIPTHFITDKEEQDLFMEAAGDVFWVYTVLKWDKNWISKPMISRKGSRN